jgi:hypothetical protein
LLRRSNLHHAPNRVGENATELSTPVLAIGEDIHPRLTLHLQGLEKQPWYNLRSTGSAW